MNTELEHEYEKLSAICKLYSKIEPWDDQRNLRLTRVSKTEWHVYGVVGEPIVGKDAIDAVRTAIKAKLDQTQKLIERIHEDLAECRNMQSEMLRTAES